MDPFWPPRPGGRNTSRAAAGRGWGSEQVSAQVSLEASGVVWWSLVGALKGLGVLSDGGSRNSYNVMGVPRFLAWNGMLAMGQGTALSCDKVLRGPVVV